MRNLTSRLEALEALPSPSLTPAPHDLLCFESFIAKFLQKEHDYKALDAAGRVRYWRDEVAPKKQPESVKRPSGCSDATYRILVDLGPTPYDLAADRWNLLEAQLDRLAELSYNALKLVEWRKVHEHFRSIPWQWRQECLELSDDALRLLE